MVVLLVVIKNYILTWKRWMIRILIKYLLLGGSVLSGVAPTGASIDFASLRHCTIANLICVVRSILRGMQMPVLAVIRLLPTPRIIKPNHHLELSWLRCRVPLWPGLLLLDSERWQLYPSAFSLQPQLQLRFLPQVQIPRIKRKPPAREGWIAIQPCLSVRWYSWLRERKHHVFDCQLGVGVLP